MRENFPEIAPRDYFGMHLHALALSASDIEAATTRAERKRLSGASQLRSMTFADSAFDVAEVVRSESGQVLFWSSDNAICGVVYSGQSNQRRDVLFMLKGVDRKTAHDIVRNLHFD